MSLHKLTLVELQKQFTAGEVTATELIAFCRARLAHYKCPRTIVFGPLAKTSTGKIQKNVLRDQARALKDS